MTTTTTVEQLMNGIQAGAYKLVKKLTRKSRPRVEYSQDGRFLFHYSGDMLHIYEDVTYKVVQETFGSGDSNPDPDDSGLNILGQHWSDIRITDVLDCLIPSEYETLDGSYNKDLKNNKFNDVCYYIHNEIVEYIDIDRGSDNFGRSFITEAVVDGKRARFLTVWCNDADSYFTYEYKKLYPRYYVDSVKINPGDAESSYYPILITVNSFEEDYDYLEGFIGSNTSLPREILDPKDVLI